jgi:hypothetical protein
MPELGVGEILSAENGAVRIRFASGERNFMWDRVAAHLTVTQEAPPKPAAKASAKRSKKAAVAKEKAAASKDA